MPIQTLQERLEKEGYFDHGDGLQRVIAKDHPPKPVLKIVEEFLRDERNQLDSAVIDKIVGDLRVVRMTRIWDGKGRSIELTVPQAKQLQADGLIFYCTHYCNCYHREENKTWEEIEKALAALSH